MYLMIENLKEENLWSKFFLWKLLDPFSISLFLYHLEMKLYIRGSCSADIMRAWRGSAFSLFLIVFTLENQAFPDFLQEEKMGHFSFFCQ